MPPVCARNRGFLGAQLRARIVGLTVLIALPGWIIDGAAAVAPDTLSVRAEEGRMRISLPREPVPPVGGSWYRHRVEGTADLESWTPAGELEAVDTGLPSLTISPGSPYRFFRLASEIEMGSGQVDGADLWGYGRVFAEELRNVGYLTPVEFAAQHQPGPEFLEKIGFDPRSSLFWDTFAANPAEVNQGKKYGDQAWRTWDFRLNESELALFLRNGFVVSPRLGAVNAPNTLAGTSGMYQIRTTFADIFYRVFNDDLPVFISADAALHAWHYSFSRMLSEIEQTHLTQLLGQILTAMTDRLARIDATVRSGPFKDSFDDADYFLAVGRSLLAGSPASPLMGTGTNVTQTLSAIAAGQSVYSFPMFGGARDVDFSQFTPRGPYTRSADLSRYFQAFMWTARADFRIFDPDRPEQSRRELADAIVLALLLQESAASEWRDLDRVLRLVVGRTDALDFAQLKPLLDLAGIRSLSDLASAQDIDGLQSRLLSGDLGLQMIPSEVHFSPMGPEQAQLPRSFAVMGQRFVSDGWAMSQVTFDRVRWFEEIPGATYFQKVIRRLPAVPDVAYAVLGNQRAAGWYLGEQMVAPRTKGNFRDGYPYAHNLTALARTFDRLEPGAWTDTIYARWLWALRALAPTNVDPRLPQAMRTRAWAMHTLNTQLASYSQLKHDTLLYGKQPYAANILCEYPAGFVEPVPEFWQRLGDLARSMADGLSAATAPTGTLFIPSATTPTVDRSARHQARITFCRQFAGRMDQLRDLAEKELRQEPHTPSDLGFIRSLMNDQSPKGYGGATYDGWYPRLFYEDFTLIGVITVSENGSNQWDPRVADLFTAPPDQVDPTGGVLHAATGNVDFMLIAVDNGPDRMVYAGPVMSYYEFVEPGPTLKRLTDEEWQQRLSTAAPPRPTWTAGHIAPGR